MDSKEAYKQKLKAQIKEWNAQINLLNAKIENKGADMKLKYSKELDALKGKQDEVLQKIKELDESSTENWEKIKVTADQMLSDLKTGLNNAISRLK
ncbi:MAG: sll1863 family stress response protein [Leptospirillum sp.]